MIRDRVLPLPMLLEPHDMTASVMLVMLSAVAFVLEMYRMTMLHKQPHSHAMACRALHLQSTLPASRAMAQVT